MQSIIPAATDVTQILQAWSEGDETAPDRLMPVVYAELRRLAGQYLRRERADHTLQATALVHEAWMKLMNQHGVSWQNRSQFFAVAAQAMRRILVDHARKRHAGKRDGGRPVTLDDQVAGVPTDTDEVLSVDEAHQRLAAMDPRQARIVELRYFGGLTIEEAADTVRASPASVAREWTVARAWLRRELAPER